MSAWRDLRYAVRSLRNAPGFFALTAIGLAGAALLTRFLGTLLFAVKPTDPVTFVGTAAVLAVAALVACALPAWRAARVDPAVTLRQE